MFIEQLRRAVEASPRVELPKVSALLWKAYAAGHVTEADAAALSEAIELRRALPAAQKPAQRLFGSRPRTIASMERRRRWAASGPLPPALASRFTLAEQAVLGVIAAEVVRHGACTLTVGHVAALAGVSETTVRNAVREARGLGLLQIEDRRVSAWRNLPNKLTIISREWRSWLAMRRRGVGANSCTPRIQESNKSTSAQRNGLRAAEGQGALRAARHRHAPEICAGPDTGGLDGTVQPPPVRLVRPVRL